MLALRLNIEREAVRASAALVSDAERIRASRFITDRERGRFIVARAWLRRLLSARLGMRPEAIEFQYGMHGKPALAPHCADLDLRFNVSHAHDVAVYAFAREREIGVDVEFVRPMLDAEDIAAHFFSRRENEAYRGLHPSERLAGFFNCWTRKEAFVKALGNGLDYPLDRFDVSLAPGEPAQILRVEGASGSACGWTLHAFTPRFGVVGAIVVQARSAEPDSRRDRQ
jgi:4'-phosphopantetheinyl transferase